MARGITPRGYAEMGQSASFQMRLIRLGHCYDQRFDNLGPVATGSARHWSTHLGRQPGEAS